jgi:hypothetical protein
LARVLIFYDQRIGDRPEKRPEKNEPKMEEILELLLGKY